MPKLSHQWGFISRDLFDRHPHAATMGMVDGPFQVAEQAEEIAAEHGEYAIMRRIPGGPWLSAAGNDPITEWTFRWGPIPRPDGATVIPLHRIP